MAKINGKEALMNANINASDNGGGVSQEDFESFKSHVSESILEIKQMIPAAGGGLSAAASAVLLEILGAGVYTTDVSSKITKLVGLLTAAPDTPDQPTDPDDPGESAYDVEQADSTLIIRAANVTQSGTRLTIS